MAGYQEAGTALPALMLQDVISTSEIIKKKGLPPFEADINLLIDSFIWQVRHGAMPTLATFKQIWQKMSFSFIHQAVPPVMQPWDHQQLLYSAALNRLDQLEGPFISEAAQAALPPDTTPERPMDLQMQATQPGTVATAVGDVGNMPTVHYTNTQQHLDEQRAIVVAAVADTSGHHDDHIAQLMEGLLDDPLLNAHGSNGHAHNHELVCVNDSNLGDIVSNQPAAGQHQQQALNVADGSTANHVQASAANVIPRPHGAVSDERQLQTEVLNYCAQVRQLAVDAMGHEVDVALREAGLTDLNQLTNPNHLLENPHATSPGTLTLSIATVPPATHYQEAYEKYQVVQGLASSLGALYCLYCLYNTQLIQPRTRIYLPVKLLKYLAALLPLYIELGLMTPVKVLQSLWSGQAFLIGAVRKPRHGEYMSHIRMSGPRTLAGLTVNPMLMHSRPIRDALLHIRSGLRTLMDFKKLADMTHDYTSMRQSVFQPRSKSKRKDAKASQQPDLPPFIFDERFAPALKAFIHDEGKTVWASLHPLARKQGGKKKQKGGKQQGEQEAIPDVAETEAPEAAVMQLTGVFGDIMRRQQEREKRAAASQSANQAPDIVSQPQTAPAQPTQAQTAMDNNKKAAQKPGRRSGIPLDPKLRKELAQAGLLVDDMEQEEEQEKAISEAVGGKAKDVVRKDLLRRTAHMEMGGAWLSAHDALMHEDDNNEDEDDDDLHMPDILGLVSNADKANNTRTPETGVSVAQNPEGLETDRLRDLGEEALAAELSQWMDEIAPEPSETEINDDQQEAVKNEGLSNENDSDVPNENSDGEQEVDAGKQSVQAGGTANDDDGLRTDVSAAIATVVRALPNARAASASWLRRGQHATPQPTTSQIPSEGQKPASKQTTATEKSQTGKGVGKAKIGKAKENKTLVASAKKGTKTSQAAPTQSDKANKRKRGPATAEASIEQAHEDDGNLAAQQPPAKKARKAAANGTAKAMADNQVGVADANPSQQAKASQANKGTGNAAGRGSKSTQSRRKAVTGTKGSKKRRRLSGEETSEDSDVEDIDMQIVDTGTSDEGMVDTDAETEETVPNRRKLRTSTRLGMQTKNTNTVISSPQLKAQSRQQLLSAHQQLKQEHRRNEAEARTASANGQETAKSASENHAPDAKAESAQRLQPHDGNAAVPVAGSDVPVQHSNNTEDVDEDPLLKRLAGLSQRNAVLLQSVRATSPQTSPQKPTAPRQLRQVATTDTDKQPVGSALHQPAAKRHLAKPSQRLPSQSTAAVVRKGGKQTKKSEAVREEPSNTPAMHEQEAEASNVVPAVATRTTTNRSKRAANGVQANHASDKARRSMSGIQQHQMSTSTAAEKPSLFQAVVDGDDIGLGLAIATDLGWITGGVAIDVGFNKQDAGSRYAQDQGIDGAMDIDSVGDLMHETEQPERKYYAATSRAAEMHGATETAELDGLSSDEEVTQALGKLPARSNANMQSRRNPPVQPFNTPSCVQPGAKKGLQQSTSPTGDSTAVAVTADVMPATRPGLSTAESSGAVRGQQPAMVLSTSSLLQTLVTQPPKQVTPPLSLQEEAAALADLLIAGLRRPLNTNTHTTVVTEDKTVAQVASSGLKPTAGSDLVAHHAQHSQTSQQAVSLAESLSAVGVGDSDPDANDDPIFTRLASLMDRTQRNLASLNTHRKG